jgi:multidrug efflux system membrane fusion protein
VTERAVGSDQGRKFVYVVDDKNKVVRRPVELGAVHDGLRVVTEGLSAGERVIIDGIQRVRPGSEVAPTPGEMRSRPGEAIAAATQKSGGPGSDKGPEAQKPAPAH